MAQYISKGNIFGRIGSEVGKGLADVIPQEVERYRLSAGLKDLEQQKGLTPQQFYTRALSVPGVVDRPSVVQELSNLARQQAFSNIYNQEGQAKSDAARNGPRPEDFARPRQDGATPSATTASSVDAALEPFIPPRYEQMVEEARGLMSKSPGIDFNTAINAIQSKYAQEQSISDARLKKRDLEKDVQKTAEGDLAQEIGLLGASVPGANIPGDVLSRLQKEAVNEVKKKTRSEKEVAEIYGKKALNIAREYSDARSLGDLTLITKSPTELLSSLKSLRQKFADRNDSRNLADTLISDSGLSPPFAYALAKPVSDQKELNSTIKSLPAIHKSARLGGMGALGNIIPNLPGTSDSGEIQQRSREASERLAPLLGEKGSPLSVYYELEKKGYDPEVWKNYLIDNQKELDLRPSQVDELSKPRGYFQGILNDWWLKAFSGIKE